MTLSSANATSARTQFEAICALGTDIVALTEHRLTDAGQRQYAKLFKERGYTCVWGHPCKRKRFNRRVTPGGVALLTRGLQARAVPVTTPARQELVEQCRLLHTVVTVGKETLHIIIVYGHPNSATDREQRTKHEHLLKEACGIIAELGMFQHFCAET